MAKLEKNNFGIVVNTRKARYCELMVSGKYSKKDILAIVKKEFGTASKNAFQFCIRDLQLMGFTVERRSILLLLPKKEEAKKEEAKKEEAKKEEAKKEEAKEKK